MKISDIKARELLDSRGNPTVEVDVVLASGVIGRAIAPSGASTGKREALELRDGDQKRYLGKGVLQAVHNVNEIISKALRGHDISMQSKIDSLLLELDGTDNKSKLGANAIVATSLAVAKARAAYMSLPLFASLDQEAALLPMPMVNILNGGMHANNLLDIQEFMIMPIAAENIRDAIRISAEVFHSLKSLLNAAGFSTSVGDEGGFAPGFNTAVTALDYILKAIEHAGYVPGQDVALALDCAASEFYDHGIYRLKGEGKELSSAELVEYYRELCKHYPIVSIEDAMAEDDKMGWNLITQELGSTIQLVGDDVFVTNPAILNQAISDKIANAILIKPNQIGTLTETIETITIARAANYNYVMSHRSGESEDTTIAHLAVGTACSQIKTGSMCRTDRVAKYNELIRIEELLGNKAKFAKFKL